MTGILNALHGSAHAAASSHAPAASDREGGAATSRRFSHADTATGRVLGNARDPALQEALNRIERVLARATRAGGLESTVAATLSQQEAETADQVRCSERTIAHNLDQARLANLERLQQIQRRAEARKKMTWWDEVMGVVKDALNTASAVVTACTGGAAGVVSAVLTIGAMIVSRTVKSDLGKGLGLGLGIGGSAVAALGGKAAGKSCGEVEQAVEQVAKGIVTLGKSQEERTMLAAEARLLELRARKQRASEGADDALDAMKEARASMSRSLDLAIKTSRRNQK